MQSASNFRATVLDADNKVHQGCQRLGHVTRYGACRAELTLETVKAALKLKELAFLLAENPLGRIPSTSCSPVPWSDLALSIFSSFRQS